MYFILEFLFYIIIYGLILYGLHVGYLYIKNNYTQRIIIDQETKNKKYDEILNHLKELETTNQENILSMDNELSNLLDNELQEEKSD
jgi:ligand-binding sensor protein